MNPSLYRTLFFCLLSFLLGWAVSHFCCRGHHGDCGGGECHGGMSQCDHGGSCCSGENSHCDKEGCDHKMGAACCKGHGKMEGKAACCAGHGMHGDKDVHVIVSDLEKSNFQGDTTINIEGGTVNVHREGDSTTVKVEMRKEERVTVHAH